MLESSVDLGIGSRHNIGARGRKVQVASGSNCFDWSGIVARKLIL